MDDLCREEIKQIISGPVLFDEPMEHHTSMGVGGMADAMIFPGSTEELRQVVIFLRDKGIAFVPVGNGTNIIVKDSGYRGVVISLTELRSLTQEKMGADKISVFAEAGVSLSSMVSFSLSESLTGIEFCTGIPGSVGGAVRMNAGAYGKEIKDVLEMLSLMDNKGKIHEVRRDLLHVEYRNLELPVGSVIVGASFALKPGDKEAIRGEINRINSLRRNKHPLEYRSAGSIFKNPRGIPAGQLIEEVGLKGIRVGNAQVSEKHGNFILNLGQAKASDILSLIDVVREKVLKEKDISLEMEVMILGEQ